MGAGSDEQMLQGGSSITNYDNYTKREDSWVMEGDHDDHDDMYDTTSLTSISNRSSTSSSDLVDDASSPSTSSSCSSSFHSHGSLLDLTDLMTQLPINRGLSKYFEGKCQSFTCLSKVKSIQDLAKKESPYNQRKALKGSESYGGGLGSYRSYTHPKAAISKSKKASTTSSFSSRSRGSSFLINNNTLPPTPVRK
ncbi:uncharacterized protein LOC103938069 isoform X1 [Pyrus x bretschneideri]|uniref:uncharacterized protein LOC103938069 isoform X1 n=1 Tax=Pyrus x bretschneideri TaxID=225117 RepID=UPI0005111D20|nr:uncharacterized protein LOC103938069 isoform X1 [Pyrus x bretschneideri]